MFKLGLYILLYFQNILTRPDIKNSQKNLGVTAKYQWMIEKEVTEMASFYNEEEIIWGSAKVWVSFCYVKFI